MPEERDPVCSQSYPLRSSSIVRVSSIRSRSDDSSFEDIDGSERQHVLRGLEKPAESRGCASDEAQEIGSSRASGADHLVVMVNGIMGSANDWKTAADLFQARLGDKVVVHRSACNSALTTFSGIDIMGRRLADEVQEVIDRTPGLKKISFVAHSLGGLVARYAIACLFSPAKQSINGAILSPGLNSVNTLAGLEPVNFITMATPHLGLRGHEQFPLLFGLRWLEKLATSIAHWFVGRTGKQLFLGDGDEGQVPLLQQMVTDCEEGMFMSALSLFKRRVTYANVINDYMVGWRTASLRRECQMPKVKLLPVNAKYPHIMHIDKVHTITEAHEILQAPALSLDMFSAEEVLEDYLLSKLIQLPWECVDVSFSEISQSLTAHSTIQAKHSSTLSEGIDVISHLIDNLEIP